MMQEEMMHGSLMQTRGHVSPMLTPSVSHSKAYLSISARDQQQDRKGDQREGNRKGEQPIELIEMSLRLSMDFSGAGKECSIARQDFVDDLKQDIVKAYLCLDPDGDPAINIMKISPDNKSFSVIVVDMSSSEKGAQEIHRQSLDPESTLLSGKITRFTETITLRTKPIPGKWAVDGLPNEKQSRITVHDRKDDFWSNARQFHHSRNEEGKIKPRMTLQDRGISLTYCVREQTDFENHFYTNVDASMLRGDATVLKDATVVTVKQTVGKEEVVYDKVKEEVVTYQNVLVGMKEPYTTRDLYASTPAYATHGNLVAPRSVSPMPPRAVSPMTRDLYASTPAYVTHGNLVAPRDPLSRRAENRSVSPMPPRAVSPMSSALYLEPTSLTSSSLRSQPSNIYASAPAATYPTMYSSSGPAGSYSPLSRRAENRSVSPMPPRAVSPESSARYIRSPAMTASTDNLHQPKSQEHLAAIYAQQQLSRPSESHQLPPGWEEFKDKSGQYFYVNHATKQRSRVDPRKLLQS